MVKVWTATKTMIGNGSKILTLFFIEKVLVC